MGKLLKTEWHYVPDSRSYRVAADVGDLLDYTPLSEMEEMPASGVTQTGVQYQKAQLKRLRKRLKERYRKENNK